MISSEDPNTAVVLPVKTRGRPRSGSALSSAARMRAKRARDLEMVNQASLNSDFSEISTRALLEAFADAVTKQYESIAKKLAKELLKRSKLD